MSESTFSAAETFYTPSVLEPEVDGIDDVVIDENLDETDESSNGTTRAAVNRSGINRAAIRRIAVKAEEIANTDPRTVEVAAAVLGTGTGLAEMTTAIMSADRSISDPFKDVALIAESSPMAAGINAAALPRKRLRAVYTLLCSLDAGSKSAMPADQIKAALSVAEAIFALDDITKAEIEAVATLLKKS
jgi:hypothetical protein